MSRPNRTEPSTTRLLAWLLIIILIAVGIIWLVFGDESPDKSQPVGKIVNVVKYDTWIEAQTDLITRLDAQPSQEARLNAFAQEGCAVMAELQRRHPDDRDGQYLDPLYKNRYMPLHDWYYLNAERTTEEFAFEKRQRKYCKDYTP